MRAFHACVKKEVREHWVYKRWQIISLLFTFFGILSVFTAKYMPDLMGYFLSSELVKSFPTPIVQDVWVQFFKNIGQVGVLVVVVLFSSLFTSEYQNHTLILPLSKGVSRWKVLLSKWSVACAVFSIPFLIAIGVTQIYSMLYFKQDSLVNIPEALLSQWVFVCFLITLIVFFSSFVSTNSQVLIGVSSVLLLCFVVSIFLENGKYLPLFLATSVNQLIANTVNKQDVYFSMIITLIVSILLLVVSLFLFNKKEID
ncbi:ABC transporter permease [Vagococcus sp. JNUCC 83]